MKLLIAVPTQDYIHYKFARSLLWLAVKLARSGIDFDVDFRANALVYDSREKLAAKARLEGFDEVLWLDSDMVFDADLYDKLSAHDKDFVTAVCHSRRKPFMSCVFSRLTPDAERYKAKAYPNELFRIAGAGFACVLTKVKLLREIKMKHGNLFMPSTAFGEDLSFCVKATQCGFDLWADPTVRPGHIGHVEITADDEIVGD